MELNIQKWESVKCKINIITPINNTVTILGNEVQIYKLEHVRREIVTDVTKKPMKFGEMLQEFCHDKSKQWY